MRWTRFVKTKAACAYFFVCPGLVYGSFTARMPALKAQVHANEAELGLVLLIFGCAGFVGLLLSAPLIRRFSSRLVVRLSTLALLCFLPLCALAQSPEMLALGCVCMGLCIGLADVAMNTQAIQLEQRFAVSCMAVMHGGYSLGGVLGALTGAFFAALNVQPVWNFALVVLLYACARPWTVPRLQKDMVIRRDNPKATPGGRRRFAMPPLFIILCGLTAACAYAAEGTVGEWGALFLFSVKGAEEGTAALVYACFSVCTVSCRMVADLARTHFSDFAIVLGGALLAVLGMSTVLCAQSPTLCLAGYSCMGLGMAPIVPILFSRGGSVPGVDASTASAVISVLAYGGLLLCPPLIGALAHAHGLQQALYVALVLCLFLVAGAFLFRKKRG